MIVQLGSIIKMSLINGIRASHGDKKGNIFLYDYVLIDMNEDTVLEERIFMQFITNKPAIFRGRIAQLSNSTKAELQDSNRTNFLVEWTRTELVIIFCWLIMTSGGMVMFLEYFNGYFVCQKDDGSLFRSLFDILFVTPITLMLLFGIICLCKCIKK